MSDLLIVALLGGACAAIVLAGEIAERRLFKDKRKTWSRR